MTTSNTNPIKAVATDIDPFSDEFLTDPYASHRLLREAGPVVWFERYGAWGVARYQEVTEIMKDPETFCSSAGVGLTNLKKAEHWRFKSLLIEADPPEHTQARHVMTKVLSPAVVRQMKSYFMERAATVVSTLVERGSFDAVTDLGEAYPMEIIPDFFGVAKEGRENLLLYAAVSFNSFGPLNKHFHAALAAAEQAQPWMAEQIRAGARSDGLCARIHEEAAAAGFTPEESGRLAGPLLTAGIDTTVNALGNAVLCLAQNPDQFAKLREDPGMARAVFEEVIRFESPLQAMFRTTTRTVEVAGVEIPAEQKVLLLLASANRDERHWGPDAEEFKIHRQTSGHVGFGFGIHACIGQMLARLEGECVLTALAQQVERIEIVGPVVRRLNNTLRGMASLPVTVTASRR